MAYEYYTKLWQGAVEDVDNILESDKKLQQLAPYDEHDKALPPIADLYVRYVLLIKKLDICYDQIMQPQKRPLIRRLLDMSIGRLLELRDMMTQIDISPYSYFDEVLFEHQLTPFDIEVPPPRYLRGGREALLQDRRERIDRIREMKGLDQEEEEQEAEAEKEAADKGKSQADKEKSQADKESGDGDKENNQADKENSQADKENSQTEEKQESQSGENEKSKAEGEDENKEGKSEAEAVKPEKKPTRLVEKQDSDDSVVAPTTLAEEARAKALEQQRAERAEREGVDPVTGELTRRGAVKLLQRHERARQARVRFSIKHDAYRAGLRKLRGQRSIKVDPDVLNEAATLVQRTWRGYISRKKEMKRETKLLLALGMAAPTSYSTVNQDAVHKVDRMRHQMQIENQIKLEERMAEEYARFMKVKAPWLREDLTDEIRAWFVDWYVKVAEFSPYPTEEEGGGMAIVSKRLVTPEKFLQKKEKLKKEKELIKQGKKKETDEQKDKKKLKAEKKKEKAEKKKKLKERKKLIKKGERLEPYEFEQSNFYPELMEGYGEYNVFWRGRDERERPDQPLEMDLLKAEVVAESTREVRMQVDDFMRLELEVLNAALERDRGKKKKKKKKKKKGKKKKKKKKKEAPELTEDELWGMFDELVEQGIIRNYPEVFLKDFMGDYSYITQELRKLLTMPDPQPGLGEVRQVVTETCILPMASPDIHRIAPLIKSVCIAGLPKSGKHFLANAVCTELGAVMFDMSPRAIANSEYSGKGGVKKFLKIAGGVARYVQPAIFFVDGAEKPFYKKIPKEEKPFKPRKVGKYLKKILKMITPEDQILILGVTNQPWAGKKGMVKLFERWIVMPVPDYSTVLMTWNMELMKYYGVDRQFQTTPLTIETRNYSMDKILNAIKDHMTLERRVRLSWDPLTPDELLVEIMKQDQYTPKQTEKLLKWYKKNVPLEKYKAKVLTNERIAEGLQEPKGKKDKKKK